MSSSKMKKKIKIVAESDQVPCIDSITGEMEIVQFKSTLNFLQ